MALANLKSFAVPGYARRCTYTDLREAFGPICESLLLSNPLELESGPSGSSSTANLSIEAGRAFSFARFAGSALGSMLPWELRNRRSRRGFDVVSPDKMRFMGKEVCPGAIVPCFEPTPPRPVRSFISTLQEREQEDNRRGT